MAEGMVEAANAYDNIYADITYTAILYGFIEYFCENASPEQLLFGTDCVMRDVAPQLGWVAWARIPYEDKLKVLASNMADILRLPEEERVTRISSG
jgi:predicted TIM-barrel fold metal-dependent hydrolase